MQELQFCVVGGLIFMGAIGDYAPFLPGDVGMDSVVSPLTGVRRLGKQTAG